MPQSPLLTAEDQRRQQEDEQQKQQASMATLYGGSGIPGFGGVSPGFDQGMAPGYGSGMPGGAAPRRDNGFTQFVSHQHGSGALYAGRYSKGPYKGMEPGEAQEQMHDDWLKLSPEERAPYYRREFGADTVDPNNPGGFFSKEQQNQVAPGFDKEFAALQGRNGVNGAASTPFNPGSMGGSGTLANNDTRPHYGMSGDNVNAGGSRQSDAIPTGQRFTQNGLASLPNVQQAPGLVPHPNFDGGSLVTMGNPNDTAKYGPAITNQSAPTYTGQIAGRNASPVPTIGQQRPQFDNSGTLITAAPQQPRFDNAGTLVTAPPPAAQQPRYLADGTLQSPLDKPGDRPFASTPIPAPPKAMASVR